MAILRLRTRLEADRASLEEARMLSLAVAAFPHPLLSLPCCRVVHLPPLPVASSLSPSLLASQSGCALGVSRVPVSCSDSMDDVFFRPVLTRRVFFLF